MKKVGTALKLISIPLFISSFFVEDNKKAVKRRWLALGMGLIGWSIGGIPKAITKK